MMGVTSKLVQLILLMIATFVALSRIMDNKHHPTDVMAGTVMGILLAIITYYYLFDQLKPKTQTLSNYQTLKKDSTNYAMDTDLEMANFISNNNNDGQITSINNNNNNQINNGGTKFELQTTNLKRGSSNQLKDSSNHLITSIQMQNETI